MSRRTGGSVARRRTEISEIRQRCHPRISRQRRGKVQHCSDDQDDEAKEAAHRRHSSQAAAGVLLQARVCAVRRNAASWSLPFWARC